MFSKGDRVIIRHVEGTIVLCTDSDRSLLLEGEPVEVMKL
jgi:hypothetical protein